MTCVLYNVARYAWMQEAAGRILQHNIKQRGGIDERYVQATWLDSRVHPFLPVLRCVVFGELCVLCVRCVVLGVLCCVEVYSEVLY